MTDEELRIRLEAMAGKLAFQERLILMQFEMLAELLYLQKGDGILDNIQRAKEFARAVCEAPATEQPVDWQNLFRQLWQDRQD